MEPVSVATHSRLIWGTKEMAVGVPLGGVTEFASGMILPGPTENPLTRPVMALAV
jgi:hypothetical protein